MLDMLSEISEKISKLKYRNMIIDACIRLILCSQIILLLTIIS